MVGSLSSESHCLNRRNEAHSVGRSPSAMASRRVRRVPIGYQPKNAASIAIIDVAKKDEIEL